MKKQLKNKGNKEEREGKREKVKKEIKSERKQVISISICSTI